MNICINILCNTRKKCFSKFIIFKINDSKKFQKNKKYLFFDKGLNFNKIMVSKYNHMTSDKATIIGAMNKNIYIITVN